MEVSKDAFVIIEYSVRLEDGSYVKGENGPASMNFVVGYDQVLPALERRLLGAGAGALLDFVVPAREAFGEHDPAQVRRRGFDEFPQGRGLCAGKWVVATHDETQAQFSYFVQEKSEDSVTLDFNHPLAGKDLYYRVKVVQVRPAEKEELEYLRPCRHEDEIPAESAAPDCQSCNS
jgi:FKBP-type peptidyl-prolyl cis-trans isomerase SlyD